MDIMTRLVTWNDNMAFRRKKDQILEYDPDLLVVQEYENPAEKGKWDGFADWRWIGENDHKDSVCPPETVSKSKPPSKSRKVDTVSLLRQMYWHCLVERLCSADHRNSDLANRRSWRQSAQFS